MIFGRTKEEPPPQSRVGRSRPAHRPVEQRGSAPAPGGGRRSGGGDSGGRIGPPEGVLVALFALVAVALVAGLLWREESRAIDDPVDRAARGAVDARDRDSLLRRDRLAGALRAVAASETPLVLNLRIAPERLTAVARNASGRRAVLNVDPAFDVTSSSFGEGTDTAVPASRIDPGIPERILAGARERGLETDDVDYVVFVPVADPASAWSLVLGSGERRHWVAATDGSDVRPIGQPSRAVRRDQARRERALERAQRANRRRQARQQRQALRRQRALQRRLQRRHECLRGARDTGDVERCLAL